MSGRAETGDELLPFLCVHRVVRTGITIVVLFFVAFMGWAALAPLESAVISSGVIVADTSPGAGGVSIATRVRPEDIIEIRLGTAVKVDFSGGNVRRLPMLTGLVTYVSPRALDDPRSGQAYFLARISLDQAAAAGFPARMLPGTPVRVEIPTGARTALDYLVEPITDIMHNGMREK